MLTPPRRTAAAGRWWRFPSLVLALLVVAPLAVPATADAARGWCRRDPIVVLQGTRVQLLVAVPKEDERRVTGPVVVDFLIPAGVSRRFVEADEGFNGHGYDVAFNTPYRREAKPPPTFRVRIRVTVPIAGRQKVPLRLEAIPNGGAPVVVVGKNAEAGLGLSLVLDAGGTEGSRSEYVDGAPSGGAP